MRTVHKYPLELTELQAIHLPQGARILTIQVQRHIPTLWAEVDTDQPTEKRHVALVGTGHPLLPEAHTYLGTVQMHDGRLVLHAYET